MLNYYYAFKFTLSNSNEILGTDVEDVNLGSVYAYGIISYNVGSYGNTAIVHYSAGLPPQIEDGSSASLFSGNALVSGAIGFPSRFSQGIVTANSSSPYSEAFAETN